MASIVTQIRLSSTATKQIRDGVRKQFPDKLFRRVLARRQKIVTRIGNFLAEVFNSTEVALALRGQSAIDLPAHFGLTDEQAEQLADGMADLIRRSIRVGKSTSSIVLTLRAVDGDWEKYTQLPGAEYYSVSKRGTFLIPVARWMLLDPNIDPITAEYEIVFDLNAQQALVSRSGRAIMMTQTAVERRGLPSNGPYVLPAIVSGRLGGNFIERTLGDPVVAEAAMTTLVSILR